MRRSLLESYLKQRRKGTDELSIEQKVDALLDAAEGNYARLNEIVEQRKGRREAKARTGNG